jgi:hypothetical protein
MMANRPEPNRRSDDESNVAKFAVPVDALVTALGLAERDADALEQALGVKTVRDLVENKYVRRAQAIMKLAEGEKAS